MYLYSIYHSGVRIDSQQYVSIVAAKSEMWRNIAAKIEIGEINDKHIVYGADSLHVSCDGWSWSVDAA